jgi:ribosome biogenesis protein ERB1
VSAAATEEEEEEEHGEESDSEDEAPVNTIGNVPLHWYEDFDHVGYDIDG